MVGWQKWLGRKVFIISKNSSHPYQGIVTDVDDVNPLAIWITIKDKFEKDVQFAAEEILTIKEEE